MKEFDYNTVFDVLVVKRSTNTHYETHYKTSIDDLIKAEKEEELQTIHTPKENGRLVMIWHEEQGIMGE